jgi:hypothetical protein
MLKTTQTSTKAVASAKTAHTAKQSGATFKISGAAAAFGIKTFTSAAHATVATAYGHMPA